MKKQRSPKGTKEQTFTTLIDSAKPDYGPKNLRALRRSLNMTQAELAKRAEVSQSAVSAFEHGDERNVSADARARIAGVLVQAEHDHSTGRNAEPTHAEQIHNLKVQLFIAQRNENSARKYAGQLEAREAQKDKELSEWKQRYDALLDLMNVKQKAVISQAEYEEKLDKAGLEKRNPEEESLRSEFEAHVKKGKA